MPQRLGPTLLGAPLAKLWQTMHFFEIDSPLVRSAALSRSAMGATPAGAAGAAAVVPAAGAAAAAVVVVVVAAGAAAGSAAATGLVAAAISAALGRGSGLSARVRR